ncbi:sensor histidine kinase [Georgenia alba]|uniref:histidine kinase n=1 Tax=Georgenia alba TaxID=2233858 RepID=A0ABW2Q9K9_9MICO
MRNAAARRWGAADVVPALVLLGTVPMTVAAGRWAHMPHRAVDWLALVLVGACPLALLWRRRRPRLVLAVVAVLVGTYLVVGYTYGPVLVSYAVAVYSVARHVPPRGALPWVALSAVVLVAHVLTDGRTVTGVLPGSAWAVVPFAIGAAVRNSAEAADRARADAVRQGVDAERLRVAQEVHDVVGHGLAAIKMQADVALHLDDPAQARRALHAISDTSGEALRDLRGTLAAVQGGGAPREPGPGLDRLADLTARMEASGMSVTLTWPERGRPVPAAVDVVAYRVVQESLTNVLKHAAERRARVTIEHRDGNLLVRVTSPLPPDGPPAVAGGLGIPGMRERVTALGGAFRAGPAHGSFEVEAVIPLGEQL